jgi:hypothetical protein
VFGAANCPKPVSGRVWPTPSPDGAKARLAAVLDHSEEQKDEQDQQQ